MSSISPFLPGLTISTPVQGISFQQFNDFCQLLNSLEDFSVAMTMYTIAGQPVSEEEFGRAAHICLGKPLDPNLVSTVFEIFDKDGEKNSSPSPLPVFFFLELHLLSYIPFPHLHLISFPLPFLYYTQIITPMTECMHNTR